MAQREKIESNKTYLVVKHHSLVEESKLPKANFEEIDVYNPKTKETIKRYIDKWGAVTGFITSIEPYDTEKKYDTRFQGFKISFDDEVIVDLAQKSAAYDTFCKVCENIDYTKPVTFSAYYNRSKDRTGFSVQQDGASVKWNYTKSDMGDCPPWEFDEDGEPDTRKQRSFLKSRVIDIAIPMVIAANEARQAESGETTEAAPVEEVVSKPKSSKAAKASSASQVLVDDSQIPF
jgi:hypothetical protein